MSNVLYIGQIRHKGMLYGGEQPAIVDRELWSRVQEQLNLTAKTGARQHHKLDTLLANLLYCAQCGQAMRELPLSPRKPAYVLRLPGRQEARTALQTETGCDERSRIVLVRDVA